MFPEGTPDDVHFEKAIELGRVYVCNDQPAVSIAHRWLREGRSFRGMVTWPQAHYRRMSDGEIVQDFEGFAREDEPFKPYPIRRIKPRR